MERSIQTNTQMQPACDYDRYSNVVQSHNECLNCYLAVLQQQIRVPEHTFISTTGARIVQSVQRKNRTGQLKIRIPKRVRNYSVLQNLQTISGSHPTSYSISAGVLLPRPQRPERKADHSPPFCAEIKNEWSLTSTPPIQLQGVAGTALFYCIP